MVRHSLKMLLVAGVAGIGVMAMGMPAQAGSDYHGGNDYNHDGGDWNKNKDNDKDKDNKDNKDHDKDWKKDCKNPPTHDWTCFDLDKSDCGRNGKNESSYTFTLDGITLTVTASSIDDHGNSHAADVNQDDNGLGVDNGNDNSNDIDNSGWTDILTFTFSGPVNVEHLEFSDFGRNDVARILDGSGNLLGDITNSMLDNDEVKVDDLAFALNGTTFQFTLPNGYNCKDGDYRIKGICVTNTVPTPAAAGAGLVMLGGLLMRRRRRQVA